MSRRSPIQPTNNKDDYKDWKIIMKNDSAQQLVLYNESDRSLQVQESNFNELNTKEERICEGCGRPWPDLKHNKNKKNSNNINNNNNFMDRNYFRLLDISSKQQTAATAPSLIKYTKTSGRKSSISSVSSVSGSSLESIIEDSSIKQQQHPKNLSDSSINQGYYKRFFREDSKLGRGSGGSVFKCQHVLDGIELGTYAVKKVPVGDDHSWLNRMLREVHILENLRHANIIEYKHAWLEYHQLTPFGPAIPCLFILMQLAEGGNLEEFVLNNLDNLDIELYCEWFEQICFGLAHLHRCGILHRDLKPSNILLNVNQEDQKVQLLITDFGECTTSEQSQFTSPADHNRTGATGTIEFVAPELLKIDRKSGQFLYQQSKSTDIWSLGLIFYFMLTGRLPYADIDDIDALKTAMCSLKQVPLPKEVNKLPRGFKKALGAMLQIDPELRPSIEQVLMLIRESPAPSPIIKVSSDNLKSSSADKNRKRLTLPPPESPPTVPQFLDENTRISLALLMICISVIPTYPTIPSIRRIVLTLIFTFAALKTSKLRSAIILLSTYIFLISVFYLNKID